jgi:hypothetical protein
MENSMGDSFLKLDDRGSAMVEGAIIYPMIILILLAMITFAIGEYTSLSHKNESHIRLRNEIGEMTKTHINKASGSKLIDKYRSFGENKNIHIAKKTGFGEDLLEATVSNQFSYGSVFFGGKTKYKSTSFVYAINEIDCLRMRGLIF